MAKDNHVTTRAEKTQYAGIALGTVLLYLALFGPPQYAPACIIIAGIIVFAVVMSIVHEEIRNSTPTMPDTK